MEREWTLSEECCHIARYWCRRGHTITPVRVEEKKKVILIPVSKCFCRLLESNKLLLTVRCQSLQKGKWDKAVITDFVGTRQSLRSLPTQTILWFCDTLCHQYYNSYGPWEKPERTDRGKWPGSRAFSQRYLLLLLSETQHQATQEHWADPTEHSLCNRKAWKQIALPIFNEHLINISKLK